MGTRTSQTRVLPSPFSLPHHTAGTLSLDLPGVLPGGAPGAFRPSGRDSQTRGHHLSRLGGRWPAVPSSGRRPSSRPNPSPLCAPCFLYPPRGRGKRGPPARGLPTSLNHQPTVHTWEVTAAAGSLPFLWPKSALPRTGNLLLVQTGDKCDDTSLPQPFQSMGTRCLNSESFVYIIHSMAALWNPTLGLVMTHSDFCQGALLLKGTGAGAREGRARVETIIHGYTSAGVRLCHHV